MAILDHSELDEVQFRSRTALETLCRPSVGAGSASSGIERCCSCSRLSAVHRAGRGQAATINPVRPRLALGDAPACSRRRIKSVIPLVGSRAVALGTGQVRMAPGITSRCWVAGRARQRACGRRDLAFRPSADTPARGGPWRTITGLCKGTSRPIRARRQGGRAPLPSAGECGLAGTPLAILAKAPRALSPVHKLLLERFPDPDAPAITLDTSPMSQGEA